MKIEIHEIISNTLNEKRELIKTSKSESIVLYADAGKVIKNLITGKIYKGFVTITGKDKVANYVEVSE